MSEFDDATLSLYFGLNDGRKADLEVISKASIEWVNSVRHATQMIDPSVNIKVEFINAHEASLSLNTILDWGEDQLEKIQHPRLLATAVGLALFLIVDAGPAYEYWFGEPDKLELSDEDREILDDLLAKISDSEELRKTNRKFFATVAQDPAVSSVGICERPHAEPVFSVPSSRFAERSGLWETDNEPETRPVEREADVVLETPQLYETDRRWRFLDKATGKPFTAKMRDEEFANSLREGGVNANLRMGIEMTIRIRFEEERKGNEWVSDPSTIEVLKVTLK